jgi:hypothetical protein
MAQGMIDLLGEEEGVKLFMRQIYKMGEHWAIQTLERLEKLGKENRLEQYIEDNMNDEVVYAFAWEGGLKERSETEAVIEWTACPIDAGFKDNGPKGLRSERSSVIMSIKLPFKDTTQSMNVSEKAA